MQHLQTSHGILQELTKHARNRAQCRGIHPDELDALLSYGRRVHDHLGGLIYTFDEEGLSQLRQEAPKSLWQRLQSHRGIYAVTSADGRVITTGHRFKRLVRDRSQAFHRSSRRKNSSARRPDLFRGASSLMM